MKYRFSYFLFFIFCVGVSSSQIKTTKPVEQPKNKTYDLGIGAGLAGGSVFLAQNVLNKNSAMGYLATLTIGPSQKAFRANIEYTHYKNINIAPTWEDIKASCIEANMQALWRFHNVKSYLFLIAGASYNIFSGYFTGQNDFLNFSSVYKPQQTATKKWLGFNTGLGYEIYYKKGCAFITYKMRVGQVKQNSDFNIMDVCIAGGLRYNVVMPTPAKLFRKIFRGTRSRYLLDT